MLADLRAACTRLGYTQQALDGLLQRPADAPSVPSVQRLRLDGPEPLVTLTRLLFLGDALEPDIAQAVLAPAAVDELIGAGLLAADRHQVRSRNRIEPYDGLLIASDHPHEEADVVTGVSPAAVATAMLTPRRPVRSLLDLGTGCGIQALLGARHSGRVVGVDVNPRALALAASNAALNGVDNVRWPQGSWFDPLGEARYDLIVSNPPYVISPQAEYLYRDSGAAPMEMVRKLIGEIPAHLEEGGLAQLMLDWHHPADGPWADPLHGWLSESGCDALILRMHEDDPVAYAAQWNRPLLFGRAAEFDEAVKRWLDYLRANRVESISWGVVFMRRRPEAESNWIRAIDVGRGPSGPAGEHVLRLFDAHDRLQTIDGPRGLLDERLKLVPGHRIDQTLTYRDGRYHSHPANVRVTPGLELRAQIDPDALPTLFRCDGTRTLRHLAGDDPALCGLVSVAAHELLGAGLLTISADPR